MTADDTLAIQRAAGNRAARMLAARSSTIQRDREGTPSRQRSSGPARDALPRLVQMQTLMASLTGTVAVDRARLDPNFDRLSRRLVGHVQTTFNRVLAWEKAATAAQLLSLRIDMMQALQDNLAADAAGRADPTGVAGFVVAMGLDAYRAHQTLEAIRGEIELAEVRRELDERLAGGAVARLGGLLAGEGSVLHVLRDHTARGASLQRGVAEEMEDLAFDLDELRVGNRISGRRIVEHDRECKDLRQEHEAWRESFEAAVGRARTVIGAVPDQLRDAFGRMLVTYSDEGGTVPMGPFRAERARYRLQSRLGGATGTVRRRGRRVRAIVDGAAFDLAPAAGMVARDGQALEVRRVRLKRPYRTSDGEPDPQATAHVQRWRPDSFELTVELGGFMTRVPHVRGLPQAQAAGRVVDAGLAPAFERRSSEIAEGIVLGVRPAPDTDVPSNSRVVLVVSRGAG